MHRKPAGEPFPAYLIRWDDNVDEQLHYVYLAEARELLQVLRASGKFRKVEIFGVISEEQAGVPDELVPLDRWERDPGSC
ncbi:MAG: hypothetical protein ACK47B_28740 [Armatimonadota bacterium]